jgi:hypothetical protein
MQIAFVVLLVVHALSGVFWAGSTFALARSGGQGARALRWPQAGASIVAIASGAGLWGMAHRGGFGPVERALAAGALAAIAAAAVQFAGSARAARSAAGGGDMAVAVVPTQRIAAGLLALTVAAMVAARYL